MNVDDLLAVGYRRRVVSGLHMLLKPLNNGAYVSITSGDGTDYPCADEDVNVTLLAGSEMGLGDVLSEYATNMSLLDEDLTLELDDGRKVWDPWGDDGILLTGSRYDLQYTAYYYYAEED